MKNPVVCTIVFVIGVGILSYAYWMVTRGVRTLNTFDKIGIPIALGCVATFLIFWSVSGFMIRNSQVLRVCIIKVRTALC